MADAKNAEKRPKFRRTQKIIDGYFQRSFAVHMLVLLVLVILIFYMFHLYTFSTLMQLAEVRSGDPADPIRLFLAENLHRANGIFFITTGVAIGVFFVWGILLSHRVAGPVFRIKKQIAEVLEGKDVRDIVLRKHDYFQDFAAVMNDFIARYREAIEKSKKG